MPRMEACFKVAMLLDVPVSKTLELFSSSRASDRSINQSIYLLGEILGAPIVWNGCD